VRPSGLPIKSRMAALIRQRSLDMAGLMVDFLKRPGFSRLPQRGHAFVDIPTFRRCLCYAFGEQWASLGMTSPEFLETYSPYIAREQTENGDALISWKQFCVDISNTAGVKSSSSPMAFQTDEVDFSQLISVANDRSMDRDNLQAVIDAEFSHDIETEEEAQQAVLKDVERVTGARSVAVTRYGSYEAKMYGRNQLGTIKQGDFSRDDNGRGDYDDGVDASDGLSNYGKRSGASGANSNTDAAAKARQAQADAIAKQQMKALKFQQMMHAKFGKEVENQLEADDDQNEAAVNTSTYYTQQRQEKSMTEKAAPKPSGGNAAITVTDFAYGSNGTTSQAQRRI